MWLSELCIISFKIMWKRIPNLKTELLNFKLFWEGCLDGVFNLDVETQ